MTVSTFRVCYSNGSAHQDILADSHRDLVNASARNTEIIRVRRLQPPFDEAFVLGFCASCQGVIFTTDPFSQDDATNTYRCRECTLAELDQDQQIAACLGHHQAMLDEEEQDEEEQEEEENHREDAKITKQEEIPLLRRRIVARLKALLDKAHADETHLICACSNLERKQMLLESAEDEYRVTVGMLEELAGSGDQTLGSRRET